ncbi:MAG: glycosyltransferase family 2 protein [Terriglobia bacterium]
MPPAGSIVIVTYNSAPHIVSCLRSLRQPGWERIVVDNGSRDESVERARAVPDTLVLANPENRGFAAAAQQGVRAARGELLLFLNPDVTAEPGALAALQVAVEPAGRAAAGGRLLNPDGTTQVGFVVRRLPTLLSVLAEVLLLTRLFPGNPWNRGYRCLDLDYDQAAEVEQPAGACLLVKRGAWEELGGFDEEFFPLWFEDVDFCRRLRARGGTIVYEPRARFHHLGAHSVATLEASEQLLYWYRNLLRYFRKHHSPLAGGVLRTGILLGMLLRMLATTLGARPPRGGGRASIRAYAQVIRCCVFGGVPYRAVRGGALE